MNAHKFCHPQPLAAPEFGCMCQLIDFQDYSHNHRIFYERKDLEIIRKILKGQGLKFQRKSA